jgi:hypothetical protein
MFIAIDIIIIIFIRKSNKTISLLLHITQPELQPALPNPFNPETTIRYSLPKTGEVSLQVYDLSGREVATLAQGYRSTGQYQLAWNAATIPSGVYWVVLRSGTEMQVQKVAVVK